MKQYGYVRISTKDQNPERQILAMQEQQIKASDIYLDKISGQDFSRPEYIKLLKVLKKGDVLVVKSIDRLGRNYGEILEQWRIITKEIEADIQVLDMPILNTNSSHSDLTGVFIADLVLQILAYVAETERAFIKQRQAEGIAAAKQRGVKFGCQKRNLPADFEKYYQMWENGEISIRKAAEALNMSDSTFFRRCRERNREKDQENCFKL
ncbi:MAG: recombinase family protein [Candidatus Gastranaerophilales bacterium]|nr:recombinase family protein [Candidatus Gastranaerophilales bacterium]